MKATLVLLLLTALLSGCAALTSNGTQAERSPGRPSGDKITSDINMSRSFPKSAESRP